MRIEEWDSSVPTEIVKKCSELYESDFVPDDLRRKNPEFYSAERFTRRVLDNYVKSPGFLMLVLRDAEDEAPVGFLTSACLIPNTAWWRGAVIADEAIDLTEDGHRTVALFDLLVARNFRGQGHATELHERFLELRQESRATLLSSAPQQPAYAIWQHWGYTIIGTKPSDSQEDPDLDIFLRDLA